MQLWPFSLLMLFSNQHVVLPPSKLLIIAPFIAFTRLLVKTLNKTKPSKNPAYKVILHFCTELLLITYWTWWSTLLFTFSVTESVQKSMDQQIPQSWAARLEGVQELAMPSPIGLVNQQPSTWQAMKFGKRRWGNNGVETSTAAALPEQGLMVLGGWNRVLSSGEGAPRLSEDIIAKWRPQSQHASKTVPWEGP